MAKKISSIILDGETADNITLLNLQEARKYLKQELADYRKGQYLHPEDVVKNGELIQHMTAIIEYFGGK
jgi:hypothetical protein